MSWNSGLTKLNDILAELYPTISLSMQVIERAGMPTRHIQFDAASTSNWYAILKQADLRKKVPAIVAVAAEEYPEQRQRLIQAEQEYTGKVEVSSAIEAEAPGGGSLSVENQIIDEEAKRRQFLVELRKILTGRFSTGELQTFCFDLGVDYDNLPGEGKSTKARELVAYCERHRLLPELIRVGQQLRPDITWPMIR